MTILYNVYMLYYMIIAKKSKGEICLHKETFVFISQIFFDYIKFCIPLYDLIKSFLI